MIVALGTDHAGFPLREAVIEVVRALGHEVLDCGATSVIPGDDYPDYAERVGRAVIEARADKPIYTLRTTITNQDGTVVLEGTALVYQESL